MTQLDAMAWFLTLNIADILLTLYVLRNGGVELNPILIKLFTKDDPDVVLVRMKVFLLSFVWLVWYFGLLPGWTLVALVVGYFGLAAWNIRTALRIWKRTQ